MIRKAADARVETRDKMRGGAGTTTLIHLLEKTDFTAKTRLCCKIILPPGSGIGEHCHEKEDEVFIVTKGRGLLHDGKSETAVSAGDTILTGKGESHAIRNDGNTNLEIYALIMCY